VIYDYGLKSPNLADKFNGLWEAIPTLFKSECPTFDFEQVPFARKNNYSTIKKMGEYIGKSIIDLNKIDINSVKTSNIVGDGYLLLNGLNATSISAHLSINNILYPDYHRDNGITTIYPMSQMLGLKNTKSYANIIYSENSYKNRLLRTIGNEDLDKRNRNLAQRKLVGSQITDNMKVTVVGSEGMIGFMNLLTNAHINKYLKPSNDNKEYIVNTVVSPLLNTDSAENLIDSLLLLIQTTLFPVAMSMGFPMLLYTLVMEKEEGVRE